MTYENHTSLSDELNKNVLLIAVTVKRWRGRYKTKDVKVEIGAKPVQEDKLTTPQWNLLPAAWHEKFTGIESKIRGLIGKVSLDFPIRGISVIPRLKCLELFEAIDQIVADEFAPLVTAFCKDWAATVEENRAALSPEQFAQALTHMGGNADDMRSRFGVSKFIVPMGSAGSFESIDGQDATAFAAEIEKQTQVFLQSTVASIVDSLQDELNAAIDNLTDRLGSGGVVRGGTLKMVEQAFDKLAGFKFVASPEVLVKLEEARRKMAENTAKGLNDDNRKGSGGVTDGLVTALTALRSQFATDSRQGGLFGRRGKSVVV